MLLLYLKLSTISQNLNDFLLTTHFKAHCHFYYNIICCMFSLISCRCVLTVCSWWTMERITDILQCPSTLLLVLLAGLVFVNFYIKRATCRYPGGPTPLPLLGNLHQIFYCGCLIKFCEKYRRIHGDVSIV